MADTDRYLETGVHKEENDSFSPSFSLKTSQVTSLSFSSFSLKCTSILNSNSEDLKVLKIKLFALMVLKKIFFQIGKIFLIFYPMNL